MKKLYRLLAPALCLCFLLAGCSFAPLDAKNLMAPPKANEDQQAIHKLLQDGASDPAFVYPKSGSYRSAIIMYDFTGDGLEDAIGFTSLEEEGGVEVRFLVKEQDQWHSAAAFRNTAMQVDRVCFGDLTGNGVSDVLIGWGSTSGTSGRTAAVNAYIYGEGSLLEYPLGVYGEMALTDFDQDGIEEVFTVDKYLPAQNEEDESTSAMARVYAWRSGAMEQVYSADADNAISSYSATVFGRLSNSLWGVVLDGAKADGSLTTQVFHVEDGVLVNTPAGVNTEEYINTFSRPSTAPFLSRDIDGDGLLEIPSVSLLPGLSQETSPDSTSYLVEWRTFQPGGSSLLRVRALMNLSENYWFRLPYTLAGNITASNDSARRTVTYTAVTQSPETGEMLLGSPLFSIRAFTRSTWESRGPTSGYEFLAAQNDVIYGIQALTWNEGMLRTIAKIQADFKLLGES